jgi:hypothetical protein
MKISDVIWDAANKCLNQHGEHSKNFWLNPPARCCSALARACGIHGMNWGELRSWINKNLGSYEVPGNFEEFNDRVSADKARSAQGARYLYLMMAYEIAKDEEENG